MCKIHIQIRPRQGPGSTHLEPQGTKKMSFVMKRIVKARFFCIRNLKASSYINNSFLQGLHEIQLC